ncbi:hypothetical protein GCK32_017564 [Trichostrongylus colubriformis]|uniref:Fumarylacetoacetase n=1 Tax=Trichostrongylus colubriformis TaxID=6319 RepID=A0AAN8FWX8_TRICO
MKLETLKKIPEDSLSLITKRDNGACLNNVDTTDCEKARKSLFVIVEAIRAENQRTSMQAVSASCSTGSRTELEITSMENVKSQEESATLPAVVVQKKAAVTLGAIRETETRTTCLNNLFSPDTPSVAFSEANNHYGKRCDSLARISPDVHYQDEGGNVKQISANLWIPPRVDTVRLINGILSNL